MDEQDGSINGQDSLGGNDVSHASVAFNDSPTLPFSFASSGEENHDRRSDEIVRIEDVSDEDAEDDDENGEIHSNGWRLPVSPLSVASAASPSPSPSPSETPLPKMKVTMSFMKAYKAMRGPRDVEPSPLFGCFVKSQKCNGADSGEEVEDDLFKLAGRDEVKLLNDVNDAIIYDCIEDNKKRKAQPFVRDSSDDEDAGRQTVFYFDLPTASPLLQENQKLPKDHSERRISGDDSGEDGDSIITDHPLDHAKLDKGWTKANGPFESDDEDSYVSDDDGNPAGARISPAIFRTLAAGCTLDNVDSLRQPVSEEASLRPLTPQDKILDVSIDTAHRNNVAPYCHRRQFDINTGEELSPAYRIEPGPASSILWSPPGVTPERAGLYLLLLQEGQGEQQQPARGTGMPSLFQRMAPWDCQELRTHLYGEIRDDRTDGMSVAPSPSSTPCSSSSSSSSPSPGSESSGSSAVQKGKRRTMTFTLGPSTSEVNEAVHNCRFDPATVSLAAVENNGSHRMGPTASRAGSYSNWRANSMATGIATERALLQTFRDSWRTIQDGQAANAILVVANEEAQAAITAQARCLANIEHQLAVCRAAELERQCREAQEHYRLQCQAERQAHRLRRRRERVVRGINEHLQSLRMTVGETAARLAQGRELQAVLAQRLRDGEARLERLCRDHGVADVDELSKVLAEQLARMGVEKEA